MNSIFPLSEIRAHKHSPSQPRHDTLRILPDDQLSHLVQTDIAIFRQNRPYDLNADKCTYTRRPTPKDIGMKKNSTGIGRVWNTFWL